MGAGILEVFILLPLVLHQSLETFDPFLLTAKVANLVSFKVHDQTNVSQAGARNTSEISDCRTVQSSHLSSGPDCLTESEHFPPFSLLWLFLLLAAGLFSLLLDFFTVFLVLELFFLFLFLKVAGGFLSASVDLLSLPDTELIC